MQSTDLLVGYAAETERASFYKKTYTHVAVAILAFIVVEYFLLQIVSPELMFTLLSGKMVWLLVLGLFWLGSMLSEKLTFSLDRNKQYMGLGLYVILQALIFLPMIYMAVAMTNGLEVIQQAAIVTLAMFAGLTATVFMTNKDFSFLRTAIIIGGFVSLGLIVAGILFGFNLGLWFSVGMVILASASILYQTNQIKYKFETSQYVGAALMLFSSVMLLFWYVLRIFMSKRS